MWLQAVKDGTALIVYCNCNLTVMQSYLQLSFLWSFLFTHQVLHGRAGPSSGSANKYLISIQPPAAVAPLVAATSNTALKMHLPGTAVHYYNIDSLKQMVKRAYDWGNTPCTKLSPMNSAVICPYAPRQKPAELDQWYKKGWWKK